MIRKIPVEQLTVGMYVHDLNCGWMDHPFVTGQFLIKDAATLKKIRDVGMREVVIDTEAGRDPGAAPPEAQARRANPLDLPARPLRVRSGRCTPDPCRCPGAAGGRR